MSHPSDPEFALVRRDGNSERAMIESDDPEELALAAAAKFGLRLDVPEVEL